MSEVKNKKKKSSMIQVSIGVLAVILAILIIIMMGIFSDIPIRQARTRTGFHSFFSPILSAYTLFYPTFSCMPTQI